MWVRSQDRMRLLQSESFEINNRLSVGKEGNIVTLDKCTIKSDDDFVIAEYSSKGKALKVLDMIDKWMFNRERFGASHTSKFAFQMPQDDEVNVDE